MPTKKQEPHTSMWGKNMKNTCETSETLFHFGEKIGKVGLFKLKAQLLNAEIGT